MLKDDLIADLEGIAEDQRLLLLSLIAMQTAKGEKNKERHAFSLQAAEHLAELVGENIDRFGDDLKAFLAANTKGQHHDNATG